MADRKRILVVDDEPNILKLISFILKSNGYEAIEANSGSECLEKLKKERPDLIILDVMMPGMDGFEVARKISSNPEISGIPILMLSSRAQFEDKMRGIESGATDYVTKPFNKEDLIQKVKECLEE